MADIGLFIRQGWRNIWKQPSILFFALLMPLLGIVPIERLPHTAPMPFWAVILLVVWLCGVMWFGMTSIAGMTFSAYSAAIGEPVSVAATWVVAKRTWRKVFLLICILIACILPFICGLSLLLFMLNRRALPSDQLVYLLGWLLAPVTAIWLAGVVAREMGIRESFGDAWKTFMQHFGVFASLGVVLVGTRYLYHLIASVVALLIKSGYDMAVLQSLDYLHLSVSVSSDVAYRLLLAVGMTIYSAFHVAVFMAAYVKYDKGVTAAASR